MKTSYSSSLKKGLNQSLNFKHQFHDSEQFKLSSYIQNFDHDTAIKGKKKSVLPYFQTMDIENTFLLFNWKQNEIRLTNAFVRFSRKNSSRLSLEGIKQKNTYAEDLFSSGSLRQGSCRATSVTWTPSVSVCECVQFVQEKKFRGKKKKKTREEKKNFHPYHENKLWSSNFNIFKLYEWNVLKWFNFFNFILPSSDICLKIGKHFINLLSWYDDLYLLQFKMVNGNVILFVSSFHMVIFSRFIIISFKDLLRFKQVFLG